MISYQLFRHKLTIYKLHPDDSGKYFCRVNDTETSAWLEVEGKLILNSINKLINFENVFFFSRQTCLRFLQGTSSQDGSLPYKINCIRMSRKSRNSPSKMVQKWCSNRCTFISQHKSLAESTWHIFLIIDLIIRKTKRTMLSRQANSFDDRLVQISND